MRALRKTMIAGTVSLAAVASLVGCSETVEEARTAASDLRDRANEEIDKARQELEEGSRDVRESAIRTAVSAGAQARMEADGTDVDGSLTCEADSPDFGTFTVSCTGATVDGDPIEVSGGQPEGGGGEIVVTVAGEQAFTSQDCFGLC